MKVLVTGGEGFIGRTLIRRLVGAKDHEGKLYTVKSVDIRHINPQIDGTQGLDLARESLALRVIQNGNFDIVVHLASSLSTPGSLESPLETFRNTVRSAVHVMEACRLTGTPAIITSSVKARDGMTPYGTSKRMVELWAQEYVRAYDCRFVINRPGTVYGPGQEGSAESGWIAWFLRARKEGLKVTLNDGGHQVRDLLHVDDYCRLLTMQMENPDRYVGEIWDVGGGVRNSVSVKEMALRLRLDYEVGPPRDGDADTYIGENKVPDWQPIIDWKDTGMF